MDYTAISSVPCAKRIQDVTDCIVVIEHGEIMEKGNHAELLEQKGRYYQLYTGQFELD